MCAFEQNNGIVGKNSPGSEGAEGGGEEARGDGRRARAERKRAGRIEVQLWFSDERKVRLCETCDKSDSE